MVNGGGGGTGSGSGVRLRLPHEFKGRPVSMPPPDTDYTSEKLNLPEINLEPKKIVAQQQQVSQMGSGDCNFFVLNSLVGLP